MKIWKDNNMKFQPFIANSYWADNYVKNRDEFLKCNVCVYTEASHILAFIAWNEKNEIINIQVLPEIQREGIGRLLVQNLKNTNNSLTAKVYEKNEVALLFFRAIGFKIAGEDIDDEVNEKYYNIKWENSENDEKSFVYFNNSIKNELIEKYNKQSNSHFYNVITELLDTNSVFDINVVDFLQNINNRTYVKDYIGVRNRLNPIFKNDNVVLYFDCNEKYEFIYEVIKDIAKVRNTKLSIVMHKPFSVEGTKKQRNYEFIKHAFEEFNFIEIDYEKIGANLNISFKDAFDSRDEEMLKAICL
jgi:putative acetyltransferase